MLTIALAKGRIADDLWPLLDAAAIPIPANVDTSRALVFEVRGDDLHTFEPRDNEAQRGVRGRGLDRSSGDVSVIRYLLAKPVDVPTYVHFGVADLGVVGKDVLLESDSDVYELLDLGVARCDLCVAGPPTERHRRPRRVASKYPKLTEQYFLGQGQSVDIVPLSGSIELASVIGLTDRIFDLVQTGETLRANGLEVFDKVTEISARLIANRSSYRLRRQQVDYLARALKESVTASKTKSEGGSIQ